MEVRILSLFDDEPVKVSELPKAKKKIIAVPTEPKEEKAPAKEKKDIKQIPKPAKTKIGDEVLEKNYYTIGETANKFKVRTSHIRFWTVQFALKVRTTRKGDRLYTPDNIEQLKRIHHLVKEQGFTIAGAKVKLKELKGKNVEELQQPDIVGALKNLRNTLLSLKNQIELL